MPFRFKIWNQGNDGQTMGIRVADVDELASFATACNQPDLAGLYHNLDDYLAAAAAASGSTPSPYSRLVDVVWLASIGYGAPRAFFGRTLVATYTGPERVTGGFASQCYCIVDAQGYPALAPHHQAIIQVQYVAGPGRDVLVVV